MSADVCVCMCGCGCVSVYPSSVDPHTHIYTHTRLKTQTHISIYQAVGIFSLSIFLSNFTLFSFSHPLFLSIYPYIFLSISLVYILIPSIMCLIYFGLKKKIKNKKILKERKKENLEIRLNKLERDLFPGIAACQFP